MSKCYTEPIELEIRWSRYSTLHNRAVEADSLVSHLYYYLKASWIAASPNDRLAASLSLIPVRLPITPKLEHSENAS